MAWSVNGNNLQMCEGDYGIQLPVQINGATFTASDTVSMTFKTAKNGDTILVKEYTPTTQGGFTLEFTEAESALFEVKSYAYALDWYQDGAFLCNIIPAASLKVVDKV